MIRCRERSVSNHLVLRPIHKVPGASPRSAAQRASAEARTPAASKPSCPGTSEDSSMGSALQRQR
jgi:hypothetical protein